MSIIGDAYIRILGETSQLSPQLQRDVGTAVTTASKGVQSQVRRQIGTVAKHAATVFGGAAFFRGTINFLQESVEASTEAEASVVRLESAYEKFPSLAGGNIEAMQRLNSALAEKIRFDDDALAGAEAQLAQFKLTEEQIKTLLPLVADFAARTGRDLPAAASAAGKAILGQGRAFKEVGLDFLDAGNDAANFDQLVKGLRDTVGGFAEREGKSAAGQAAILANQFGEMKETVGDALLPVLHAIVPPITAIFVGFRKLPGPVKAVTLGVAGLVVGLAGLGLAVTTIRTGLSGLGITFGTTAAESGTLTAAQVAAAASATGMAAAEGTAAAAIEAEGFAAQTAALQNQGLNVSQIEVAASGTAARTGLGGLTGGVAKYAGVVGLAITAGVLWKKNLDDIHFASVEQQKSTEAGIGLIQQYTDNAIAGNHTRDDVIRTIRAEVQAVKDENGTAQQFAATVAAGEEALKRYDSATAGATDTQRKLPPALRESGRALDGLALKLGNVRAELDQLNRIGVPAVLANELINAPGTPAASPTPTFGTTPAPAPGTGTVQVVLDGRVVQESGKRRRVLLGGG